MLSRRPVVEIVALGAMGCSSPPESTAGPVELEFVREIVRPDTTSSTNWIGRSIGMRYDPTSGNLLAISLDEAHVWEMNLDGQLIRTYGRRGEGPGELRNPLAVLVSDRAVTIFDQGNRKLAIFDRGEGEPREQRLPYPYVHVATGDSGDLYAVPGTDSVAVDVFDADGVQGTGFGRRGHLPGVCLNCFIGPVGSDAVVIVDADRPELIVVGKDGALRRRVRLEAMPLLRDWQEEEAELLAGVPNVQGGKMWVSDLEVLDERTVLLAMIPPRPHERGRELWEVDLFDDRVTRYRFDDSEAGYDIAVAWPCVYSNQVSDGSIREYRVPGEPDARRTSDNRSSGGCGP